MTIGSLFIALGFRVQGQQQFNAAQLGLKRAAIDATKLTLVINAVNVALLALMHTGTRFAVGMKNFTLETGLSTQSLQKWQHEAEVNDVTAAELTQTIKGLQDVRASFALGEPKEVGAWSLLGVDPRQDPFVVLENLRKKLRDVSDVGVARNLAERVGISENVFQMLRASNDEFSRWKRQFEVTQAQQDRLVRLNRAWHDLTYSLQAVRVQLASALAPAMEWLARVVGVVAKQVAILNHWLNSTNLLARVFRWVMGALAVAFLVAGVAAAVIAAALASLAAVVALLSPALLALLPILGELAVFLGLLLAFIVAIVLAVDDVITSFQGGKAVTRQIGEWLASFELVEAALIRIMALWDGLLKLRTKGQGFFEGMFQALTPEANAPQDEIDRMNQANRGAAWFAPKNLNLGAGPSVHQENNVDIRIDGARSPEATARAVGRSVKEEINSAAYQLPVPTR